MITRGFLPHLPSNVRSRSVVSPLWKGGSRKVFREREGSFRMGGSNCNGWQLQGLGASGCIYAKHLSSLVCLFLSTVMIVVEYLCNKTWRNRFAFEQWHLRALYDKRGTAVFCMHGRSSLAHSLHCLFSPLLVCIHTLIL